VFLYAGRLKAACGVWRQALKALHVVGGLGPNNGGPAYTVPRLCQALKVAQFEPSIFTLVEQDSPERLGATLFPPFATTVPILRQLKLSPAMNREIHRFVATVDVVHSHGLWIAPNVYAGHSAANGGKPLVVSPRGMVAPGALQFSTVKKGMAWTLWQGPAYRNAALWHATSRQEADEIRAFGIRAPVAVVPNGVDLPNRVAHHSLCKSQRTILFLSRLHPKKGLPVLLEAWRQLANDRPDWSVIIAGPDELGHRAALEEVVRQADIPRIKFVGSVFGDEKEGLLTEADLFVLPTMSENFGIAVAEALGAGIPAIVTKGAPWQGLEANRCGWWIDQGVAPLLAALREGTAASASERKAMGLRGREWMRRDFAWDAIGREMAAVYRWIAGQGERPSCVLSA